MNPPKQSKNNQSSLCLLMLNKLSLYADLTRQNKSIGTLLLVGSTSWGLILAAQRQHDWLIISIFILCAWIMRSAGCIINDYADRNFDKSVQRTKTRPLTTGQINSREALAVFIFLCLICLILSIIFLRYEVLYGALVTFIAIVIYPFMKRFTWYPQLFLAIVFASPIPMAFLAYQGTVTPLAWITFILAGIWTFCYDTIYALLDVKDDIKIGIKSTALLFGSNTLKIVAVLQGLFLLGWAIVALWQELGIIFWLSLCGCLGLFIYQYWLVNQSSKSPNPNQYILQAFKNNHWIGLLIALGLLSFSV